MDDDSHGRLPEEGSVLPRGQQRSLQLESRPQRFGDPMWGAQFGSVSHGPRYDRQALLRARAIYLNNGIVSREKSKDSIRMLHFPGLDMGGKDRDRERRRDRDRRGGRDDDDGDDRPHAHPGESMPGGSMSAGTSSTGEQKKQKADCPTQ